MLEYIRAARRRRDDKGASAVEYGLLIAAIAGVIIAIAFALGTFVQDSFQDTCEDLGAGTVERPGCTEPAAE